jgi:hypothetical protein
MTRRPVVSTTRLPIRRHFDPSRSQLRSLAFAFEQALPLIRRARNHSIELMLDSSQLNPKSRSAASGARS